MLFSYRTTPNSTTGHSSAELFLNERPKTRLDLLKLDLGRKIETKENGQKTAQNAHSKVLLQNFRGEQKWLEAVDQILSRKDSGKSKKVNKDNYIDLNQVSSDATNDSPPSDVARFSDQGGPRKYWGGPHCRNSNQTKTEMGKQNTYRQGVQ